MNDIDLPQMINCASNPYDLSLPVQVILQDVKARLHENSGAPLVVLLGEHHSVVPSVLLPQAFMKVALDNGLSFSYATELPHNTISKLNEYLQQQYAVEAPQDLPLDIFFHYVLGTEHPLHTNQNEFKFLLKQNITPCFCDAARDLVEVDLSDSLTREFQRCVEPKPINKSSVFNQDISGMHIRNQMMVELGLQHMRNEGHNVLVQRVGGAHVIGDIMGNVYAKSMMGLYRAKGVDVLGIFLERGDTANKLLFEEGDVPVKDLYSITGWNDMPRIEQRCDAERMEIYKTSKASQGALEFYDITDDCRATHIKKVDAYFGSFKKPKSTRSPKL